MENDKDGSWCIRLKDEAVAAHEGISRRTLYEELLPDTLDVTMGSI